MAPNIKRLRNLRQTFMDFEAGYNEKKKNYDNLVMNLDHDKNKLDQDVKTNFEEYKQEETKYHWHNIQSEIYDAFLKRISNEAKFVNTPDKRLSNEFKSYSEFFNAKVLLPLIDPILAETAGEHHQRLEKPLEAYQGQHGKLFSIGEALPKLEAFIASEVERACKLRHEGLLGQPSERIRQIRRGRCKLTVLTLINYDVHIKILFKLSILLHCFVKHFFQGALLFFLFVHSAALIEGRFCKLFLRPCLILHFQVLRVVIFVFLVLFVF